MKWSYFTPTYNWLVENPLCFRRSQVASDGGGSIERYDPYGHFACTRKFSHHGHGLNHPSASNILSGHLLKDKNDMVLTLNSILIILCMYINLNVNIYDSIFNKM